MKKKINTYTMEIQKWQKQIKNRNRLITALYSQMIQNGCDYKYPTNQKLRQPRKPSKASKLTSPRQRRRPRSRPRQRPKQN